MPTLKTSQRCFLGCVARIPVFDPKKASGNLCGFYPVYTLTPLDRFCFRTTPLLIPFVVKTKKVHFKDLGVKRERPRRFSLAFFHVENGKTGTRATALV